MACVVRGHFVKGLGGLTIFQNGERILEDRFGQLDGEGPKEGVRSCCRCPDEGGWLRASEAGMASLHSPGSLPGPSRRLWGQGTTGTPRAARELGAAVQ